MANNTRTQFGGITVVDPHKVIKAGLVYDWYKASRLPALWDEAESVASLSNHFFQEQIQQGALWYSFRFYTPKSNIEEKHHDHT